MSCAYFNYLCPGPDIAAVGTNFNVFSYDSVLSRDTNLSPHDDQRMRMLCNGRGLYKNKNNFDLFYLVF